VTKRLSGDARTVLWMCLGVLGLILVAAFLAPAREDNDPVPSTWNSGAAGAKAAYLLLGQLGYTTERWEKPTAALSNTDAAHTTLILAESTLEDNTKETPGVAAFLNRGGRVVATGAMSALMLPQADIAGPTRVYMNLCYTTPQSLSALARAGQVAMPVPIRWKGSNVRVDQACGDDAVVVHYPVGAGEAVWWSSSAPLSNRGLRDDADLRLLLASVGAPGRTVLFDEYIHGEREGLWATVGGTPVKALCWQLAAVALLLVLSFGRRNGALRPLARATRTSPLEFAESMGALYQKAGAADVATSAAERRLMDFLHNEGGIPRETLRSAPEAIATAVAARFFYTSSDFVADLQTTRQAEFKHLSAKSALELVRRIDGHIARLTALMTNSQSEQKNGERRD
jgi:Domain of unknown function (DUF4350)